MSHAACERCGRLPPLIERGPWAGSRHELDYCALCSKDLCPACLLEGRCREATDGRHKVERDCPSCAGRGCATCGDGTVHKLIEDVKEDD